MRNISSCEKSYVYSVCPTPSRPAEASNQTQSATCRNFLIVGCVCRRRKDAAHVLEGCGICLRQGASLRAPCRGHRPSLGPSQNPWKSTANEERGLLDAAAQRKRSFASVSAFGDRPPPGSSSNQHAIAHGDQTKNPLEPSLPGVSRTGDVPR